MNKRYSAKFNFKSQIGMPAEALTQAGIILLICVICEAERSPDPQRGIGVASRR